MVTPPHPDCGGYYPLSASCVSSLAKTLQTVVYPIPQHCPNAIIEMKASCAMGCAVEGELGFNAVHSPAVDRLVSTPAVMCAETPSAKVGDACTGVNWPCLPTRSTLNPDGTVMTRTDLVCNGTTCVAASTQPPLWSTTLQACDSSTLTDWGSTNGTPGARAYAPMTRCLLVWDDTMQKALGALTKECLGDWQCPRDALCDDQIPLFPASTRRVAVCKPGPRGVVTPAMVTP